MQRHDDRQSPDRRRVVTGGLALSLEALVAPRIALAQPAERMRRIGWLHATPDLIVRPSLREALRELGWIDGRNIAFEARYFDGQREPAAAMAKELVTAKVDVIVAVAPTAIRAAMQATSDVPIVMAWWGGPDLVESGVIASYARPGGNVTGVDMLLSALDAKRLDVLHQAVPRATRFAVLVHGLATFEPQMPAVREVARKSGITLELIDTETTGTGYDKAFEALVRARCQALLVMASTVFGRDRKLIIERAARWHVPAIYGGAVSAREGGLMSYGATPLELDRQVARQIDRILRGAKPGGLAVEQPSRYELVINLATARGLGLVIPQAMLQQADQVID